MADMLEAVRVAFLLRNSQVEQWRLPADGTVRQFTYAGGDGQLLDFEQNRALLHDFMFPESFMVVE